jgi:hypothetical protein
MEKSKDEILKMSDEEAICWIYQVPIGSSKFYPPDDPEEYSKFIERHNEIYYKYGLTRLGIQLEPTKSGELIVDIHGN